MKRTNVWLSLRIVPLLFLSRMGLLANPAQAQTRAYVTNVGDNSVSVIDTASNTVAATVVVGTQPVMVAITPGIGPPSNKNQCKDGSWQTFIIPHKFKNQGDCVSFVNTGK